VFQPELDIHETSGKAEAYNITTPPKVIEEGFNAACELICCLLGDGRRIKTPLCTVRTRLPGEYGGSEAGLAPGARPNCGNTSPGGCGRCSTKTRTASSPKRLTRATGM
jgi:hypothetical protein